MMQNGASASECPGDTNLPWREWLLLMSLGLLTLLTLVCFLELAARKLIPESGSVFRGCMLLNDPSAGTQGIPNSSCAEQSPEGPLTEYRFNACGDRTSGDCGPKSPGTFRIVLVGSSFGFGFMVPSDKTFAALLPIELSQETGRTIEVYNESMVGRFPLQVTSRFSEVLAAKPDMVLWVLTPADIQFSSRGMPPPAELSPNEFGSHMRPLVKVLNFVLQHGNGWYEHIGILLRHILYTNETQAQYVTSFLMNGDDSSGFLKAQLSANWTNHLRQFDARAALVESRSKAAGIPFVAVLVPNRAQAAMISTGRWPAGYDPYKLDNELRSIIESHGGMYVDVLPDYRLIPNPERHYFPVDGHPDPDGHAIISHLLARQLSSGTVPAFKVTVSRQAVLGHGN